MIRLLNIFFLLCFLTLIDCTRVDLDLIRSPDSTPIPQIKDYNFIIKLLASDGAEGNNFGQYISLSADGNTALIGFPKDDYKGTWSGLAYLYRWNNFNGQWVEKKLIPSDGKAYAMFGVSVSLSRDGNTALIGADWDDDKGSKSGSAYIYRWNSSTGQWDEQKIVASDGAQEELFGGSVSLSGDGNTALIGAYWDDGNGTDSGSAYIYRWNSSTGQWDEQKIVASDGTQDDWFGGSVSLSGDGNTALIGAGWDAENGTDSGSAYLYRWNNFNGQWVEKKLIPSDGVEGSAFGRSVAVSEDGNTALIGADDSNRAADGYGSAYLYRWNSFNGQWSEKKLTAKNKVLGSYFGSTVSLSSNGDIALIGAQLDQNNDLIRTGSAYIYRWNSSTGQWVEKKVVSLDGATGDFFGSSVSLSGDGNTALIGAYYDDENGTDSGSAYLYKYE